MVSIIAAVFVAALVSCCYAQTPMQVHLALTGSSDSMVASWFTLNETSTSVVKYGVSTGTYQWKAVGTSRSYSTSVGWTHDALLANLKTATRYFYVVGDETAGYSAEYNFTTSRNADEKRPDDVSAIIPMYGDMGAVNSNDTIARLMNWLPEADFFYHVGDISYADDVPSTEFERTWDAWFTDMAAILPFTPYMVCPGNHEHASRAPVLEYTKYFRVFNYRFSMPFQESQSTTNTSMWYSFDYGGVHFISISTETDYLGSEFDTDFGDQGAWLKADLAAAAANRANVPWIVAVGHRPLYSSDPSPYVRVFLPALQHFIEDLFHEYKVDLFVCGHVHAYERSYPMYKGEPTSQNYTNPTGLVQIVAGAAGCPEGVQALDPPGSWSAHQYAHGKGYGILQVHNATALTWSYYRSADDGLEDGFTIIRS